MAIGPISIAREPALSTESGVGFGHQPVPGCVDPKAIILVKLTLMNPSDRFSSGDSREALGGPTSPESRYLGPGV